MLMFYVFELFNSRFGPFKHALKVLKIEEPGGTISNSTPNLETKNTAMTLHSYTSISSTCAPKHQCEMTINFAI
jgi:hypothetical protein